MRIDKENFEKLKTLSSIDEKIEEHKKSAKAFRQKDAQIKETINALNKEAEDIKTASETVHLKKKEAMSALSDAENLIKKHQGELNSIKSNEAFKALLSEIDALKAKKDALETDVLAFMDEVVLAQAKEAKLKSELSEKMGILKLESQKSLKEAEDADSRVEKEAKERAEFVLNLDPAVLSKYEAIYKKKFPVLSSVLKKDSKVFCFECKMALTAEQLSSLGKGEPMVFCDNCGRMVHF